MTDEPTNPLSSGSDNVAPSDDLTNSMESEAANLLDDDEEDQGQAEGETESEPSSETDEPGEGQEAEEKDEGAKSEDETEAKEVSAEDGVTVALKDGTKVPLKELTEGYLREADYRRKTQELSNERRALSDRATHVSKVLESVTEQLATMIPQNPDQSLAYSDPNAYVQQKAAHEAALAQLQVIIAKAQETKKAGDETTAETRQERLAQMDRVILDRFPEFKDATKWKAENAKTSDFAIRTMGFSPQELGGVEDGRMIVALHYARKGFEAEAAKKTVAKKIDGKPPVVAPQKATRTTNGDRDRHRQAVANFNKSPTIENALALDF